MSGQRQPIELVLAKGSKHLTQKEFEERKSSEVKPITDDISPPPYLSTKKQRNEFNRIANQLMKLKILGETDVDTLARYVLSRDLYVKVLEYAHGKAYKRSTAPDIKTTQGKERIYGDQSKTVNRSYFCAKIWFRRRNRKHQGGQNGRK